MGRQQEAGGDHAEVVKVVGHRAVYGKMILEQLVEGFSKEVKDEGGNI